MFPVKPIFGEGAEKLPDWQTRWVVVHHSPIMAMFVNRAIELIRIIVADNLNGTGPLPILTLPTKRGQSANKAIFGIKLNSWLSALTIVSCNYIYSNEFDMSVNNWWLKWEIWCNTFFFAEAATYAIFEFLVLLFLLCVQKVFLFLPPQRKQMSYKFRSVNYSF